MVTEKWSGGYKYFTIDLDDGEARMCLSPCKKARIYMHAYGVEMEPKAKVFYVDFIKVSPQYRNRGYGTILLKAAMQWADTSKNVIILDAIPLETSIGQHRLVRFYLTNGFKLADYPGNERSMYYHTRDKLKKPRRV